MLQFKDVFNPVTIESTFNKVVKNGLAANSWDNIHQTQFDRVDEPGEGILQGVLGGCPDCVHTHWRWGAAFRDPPPSLGFLKLPYAGIELVGKNPSLFVPTNQDLDIGIIRYRAGEEHPTGDFRSLVNNERLQDPIVYPSPRHIRMPQFYRPVDVLYWYSGTSYEPDSDLFFKHGSWFNPDFPQQTVSNSSASGESTTQTVQDGIRSITYGHLYKDGTT